MSEEQSGPIKFLVDWYWELKQCKWYIHNSSMRWQPPLESMFNSFPPLGKTYGIFHKLDASFKCFQRTKKWKTVAESVRAIETPLSLSPRLSSIFIKHSLHLEEPLNLCYVCLCGLWRVSSSLVGNCLLSAFYHISSKKMWGLSSLWNSSTRLSPPFLFSVFCLLPFALPVSSFSFSFSTPLRNLKCRLVLWKECLWKSRSDSF